MPRARPPALAKRAKSPRRGATAATTRGSDKGGLAASAPTAPGGGIIAAAIERLDKKAEEGSGGLNIVRLALLSPESAAKEAWGRSGGDGGGGGSSPPDAVPGGGGGSDTARRSAAAAAGGGDAALEALAVATMLRTGEDAIAFFARYGDSCPVKFVHLSRAPEGKRFRPYDLVVVPESETGAEYFTMSGKGVVHIAPDAPSVFIPLSEWMRQSAMFNVLSSKHYFKHYLVGKALHRWCANVRFNRFAAQRSALSHRLFGAMSAFCGPIGEIHGVLYEMMKVPLIEATSKKTYELVDFDAAQAKCRADATSALDVHQKKILHVVERVVVDITGRAKVDEDEDAKADAHKSSKTQSMLAAKQELARKARALKQARTEEAMLGHFIRYVDYMCVEVLVELAISAHERFLGELVSPAAKRKVGLFETSVKFNAAGTAFEPTFDEYAVMIRHVSELTISVVQHVERLLYHRAFKTFTHGLYTDPPLADALIRDSPQFQVARARILEKFRDDFDEAVEYATAFKEVRPIYDSMQGQEADLEKLKTGNWSVSAIKGDMARINGWEKELERMHAQHMREVDPEKCPGGGILHVESRKLKLLLTPVTTNALLRIKAMLREVAKERCADVLREYTERGRQLEGRPRSLPTFAAYVEKLKELKAEEKQFGKATSVVEEMYRLLTTCGVRTNSEEQVQVDEMRGAQARYQEESVKSDDFVADRMKDMTVMLENSISKLNEEIVALRATVEAGVFVDATAEPGAVLSSLASVGATLASQEERAGTYNKWQGLFGTQVFEFKAVRAFQETFKLRQGLWASLHRFKTLHHSWMHSPLGRVDVEELNRSVQVLLKTAFVADKKLNDDVSARFKNEVQDFKRVVPIIMDLGNPNMRERHWEKLYAGLGQAWIPGNDTFTIEELASYGVFDRPDLVADLSGTASGEAQLEESLRKIKSVWATTEFGCKNYREQRKVFILSGLDEVFLALEDNQVTLQTMMGSRYIEGVRAEVEEWDRRLSMLSDTLDEWVTVQKNWMYLETIFTAEDIQKQLPAEATKFMKVDKTWKSIMVKTQGAPLVINAVADGPVMKNQLVMCNTLLEEIQKSLEDYLETKRSGFPRFYFLSNDELLQILSQTRDPTAVQPHLRKCFDSIARVDFAARESNEIVAMISAEGEKVKFSSPVKAAGNVEAWLTDVESMMCTSLYDKSKAALKDYPPHEAATRRAGWFFKYPAQVILVVDQIVWTGNCRGAIDAAGKGKASALKDFLTYSLEQINDMVTLVRGELSKLDRTLLGALVVIDVHARDTIMTMVRKGVKSLDDFEWTRQLRYTWEDDVDDCVCRQTNTYFRYCYEYLGNGPRLVITPLTDKCYMTLTGALHLKFGGAPAGPAGTGKTETVKDLSKALAVQCVVFNCSDGLDYKMMGRFFSGLAQSGAWACFDEFNRIDIEVLSVIAQQILGIQQGLMIGAKEIDFEGRVIPLSPQFGVFITMNPGYAGRTELPDNLKALFRPVAMMVPDYRLIAEIILFSQGFQEALALSNKMVQLYKLASEQLSKQDHYDFGMRAVKSVLVAAGQLKRKEPDVDENILLIRAMRDSNVPKFLSHDLPLFSGIVQDLFPGVNVPFVDYGKLQMAIENQLEKRGLQKIDTLITKIIQVHETQLVRHGMMIVGEAGSAKSTNSGVLSDALNQLKDDGVVDKDGFFQHTTLYTLNPKSITMGELYGEFDSVRACARARACACACACLCVPAALTSPRARRSPRSGRTASSRRSSGTPSRTRRPTASGSTSTAPLTRSGSSP
jgi:dynein heavy chain